MTVVATRVGCNRVVLGPRRLQKPIQKPAAAGIRPPDFARIAPTGVSHGRRSARSSTGIITPSLRRPVGVLYRSGRACYLNTNSV